MYAAYQIQNLEFNESAELIKLGQESENTTKEIVNQLIASFVKPDGAVDAASMMGAWFPQTNANVFISHARADKDFAHALSGWLQRRFHLKPFIDSCVWSHADHLLKKIDNKWCYQEDSNTYAYEKRNVTTVHVHMMLSTALTKMMDSCECVFFLNTDNSINSKSIEDMVAGVNEITHSPWLFHEISMMQLLRRKSKEAHRGELKLASEGKEVRASFVARFDYPVDLKDLPVVTVADINRWHKSESKQNNALDTLYYICPPKNPSPEK